jgi:hypothetical protein
MTPPDQTAAEPTDQLPAVPLAAAGDQAAWRYIDFFTANIRNPNHASGLYACLRHLSRLMSRRGTVSQLSDVPSNFADLISSNYSPPCWVSQGR